MNKKLIGLFIVLFMFVSTAVSVQAASLTNTQIQAILDLLSSFGADSATIANVNVALTGGVQIPSSCLTLTSNLYLGLNDNDTGGDVTKLQMFLAKDKSIYPEGLVTGYYGLTTEEAVKRWQAANGIVSSGTSETTGYGVVGPSTRGKMIAMCGVSTEYPPLPTYCDEECQKSNPGGYIWYEFEHNKFSQLDTIFNWVHTPNKNNVGIYPALSQFWMEAEGGYVGPQIEVQDNGNKIIKKAIFSIWDTADDNRTAQPAHSNCQRFGGEGTGAQCIIHNDPTAQSGGYYNEQIWKEGEEYKITIQKDKETEDSVIWSAKLVNLRTGAEKLIGKIELKDSKGYKGYGLITSTSVGFFEYYFGDKNKCLDAEYGKIIRKGPYADGKWLPKKGTYVNPACIRSNRYSSEPGVVTEEVGEGVSRSESKPLSGVLWELPQDIYIGGNVGLKIQTTLQMASVFNIFEGVFGHFVKWFSK